MISAENLAHALGAKKVGKSWKAKCPAHDDENPSFEISEKDGKTLFRCWAGCKQADVLKVLIDRGIVADRKATVPTNGKGSNGANGHAHLTVADFAAYKGLELDLLKACGVHDETWSRAPAVAFEYRNAAGKLIGTKYRLAMSGKDHFRWSGNNCLYGLWRPIDATKPLLLCEGESDCLTLWQQGYQALGLPGASMWDKTIVDLPVAPTTYAIIEPDAGGDSILKSIRADASLHNRTKLVKMSKDAKDPSALWLLDRAGFNNAFNALLATAVTANTDATSVVKPIILRHISEIIAERREPRWLLHRILEQGVLAIVAGKRSTFKSFLVLHWAMRMAIDNFPGIILSGEGQGLDRRMVAWLMEHNRGDLDVADFPLVALERPRNFTAVSELEAMRDATRALKRKPAFIVIDTLSKFSAGLDENDNSEVAAFLEGVSEYLRDDNPECTIILVAHAGHGDDSRPRGASALMANPEAEYIVKRPDPLGMLFTVSRERFKDAPSMPPLGYEAKLIDLGRVDRYGDRVTSFTLITTDAPAPKPTAAGRGKHQQAVMVALKEWSRTHAGDSLLSSIDIRAICNAQGVGAKRQFEVLNSMVNARILSPATGGYTVHPENL